MHARGVGAASEIQVPVKVLRTGAGSAHIFDIIAVTVEATGTIATVRKKILNHFVAAAAAAAGSVNGAAAAAITGEVHDDVHLIMGGRLLPDDFCMLQWDGQTIHCVRRQELASRSSCRIKRSNSVVDEAAGEYDAAKEYNFVEKMREQRKHVKLVEGDGNCMFRSIADQVYGDEEMYMHTREMCMDYMEVNHDYFSQFVATETESFAEYVCRKRADKCFGNHLELQVYAELFGRRIEIYESMYPGAKPRIEVGRTSGDEQANTVPIRLSYHNENHYNSIEDMDNSNYLDALGLPGQRGGIEKQIVDNAIEQSELELEIQEINRREIEELQKQASQDDEESLSAALEASRKDGSGAAGEHVQSSIELLCSMGFVRTDCEDAYVVNDGDMDACVTYLIERHHELATYQ